MKQKLYAGIVKKLASGMAMFGIAASGNVFAYQAIDHQKGMISKEKVMAEREENKFWDLGKGWILTSSGGLSYVHPNDDSYWFKFSGVVRLDETVFMGSYRDKQPMYVGNSSAISFPSSAHIRTVETYMDGGLGEDWEYTLGLSFNGNNVGFTDTWLSYMGFLENNQVFVGHVSGNWFGLDNANSTSWNPFLHRSLTSHAFYPGDGLGVMTDFWWDMGAITFTAMQPVQRPSSNGSQSIANSNGSEVIPGVRDRWHGTARATIAPVHEVGNVWHFGVSSAYRELNSTVKGVPANQLNQVGTGVVFMTGPDAAGRNTVKLLNTTVGNVSDQVGNQYYPIRANNVRMFNVEMARQIGSFMLEGEYTNVFVHRIGNPLNGGNPRGTLRFDGWNIQSRYLLTGESHEYDVRDGAFGSLKPNNNYGAVELATRYDYITLNDKDVRGGSEHNVTIGLNWFINQQVRLSANYIRASIHPALDAPKRDLDIIGVRCQIRFK